MKIWTGDEARQFLTTASNHRLYALFYLALSTGMRQMELLGLKWQDFDELRGVLHVQRQLSRSGGVFLPLKTKAAKRSIKLSNDMIKALQKHNQLQLKERYEAGDHWKEMDLIFTSTIGTPLNFKNIIERHFKPILKASNAPVIRFHDLRHTASSLMMNTDVPPIVVTMLMGHSRPSITLDIYGHLIPGMQSEVADLIDELVMPVAIQIDQKVS
jgi:integrase